MLSVINGVVWFYRKPVDFRKQLNGLITLIADELDQNPANGDMYVFRSRQSKQVKIVFWQNDGFWLCQKRLEGKRFRFPAESDEQSMLTPTQLSWLLSGMNVQKAPKRIEPPSRFY